MKWAHFFGGRVHMKKNTFLRGALIVSAGGIAAKALGALYRIPLTNNLGGEGMGIYQMVFPFYCLLLTLSATGIPAAVARLVASSPARAGGVLRSSLMLFSLIGAASALLMYALAPAMSALQGAPAAASAYRLLSPALFFVAVISCYRGRFQGENNFLPTALSEIVEQAVKIGCGLAFFAFFSGTRAVPFAFCAVTLSEAAAALFLALCARPVRRPLFREGGVRAASLLFVTLPVTLSAAVLPLSNLLDSILIVRLVGRYASDATALYGLYAGGASTIVNLPVSVCYGIAAACVPAVARAKDAREAEEKTCFALMCTLLIALPASLFLFLFPAQVTSFLFRSLPSQESAVLAGLVRASAFSALLLALVQTLASCMAGRGQAKRAALYMGIAAAVKLACECILLPVPRISVYGAAYACIACYLVALLLDLLYSIRERKNRLRLIAEAGRAGMLSAAAAGAALALRGAHVLFLLGAGGAVYLAFGALSFALIGERSLLRRKRHGHDRRFGLQSRGSRRRRKADARLGRARHFAHGRDARGGGRPRAGRSL